MSESHSSPTMHGITSTGRNRRPPTRGRCSAPRLVGGRRRGQVALRCPLMLNSDQIALGLAERPEEPVVEARVMDRIDRRIPPLHNRSPAGGVAHPPLAAVGAEHQVRRHRQRPVEGVAHGLGPVLVVADGEYQTVLQQRPGGGGVRLRCGRKRRYRCDPGSGPRAAPAFVTISSNVRSSRAGRRHLEGVLGVADGRGSYRPTVGGLPRIDQHRNQTAPLADPRAVATILGSPHGADVSRHAKSSELIS